ncbi:hypothetical protein Ddye_007622 [Dipteronia dyeriana]|uniref:2-oxoglutarate-dependent dioxygenase DAO n=1 Tax=Dipteronia dyeriana TaxID=168575 RepID=A0AAE0CRU9_9ROSI|nr:hypothetical protein Ddye_007622 [Dipteronia dyeriana]
MGSESTQIPYIYFSGEVLDHFDHDREVGGGGSGVGGEKWKVLCSQVREALENHGCFILFYDKISMTLREEMFNTMNDLFDLPEETKNKYVNPRPYRSYSGAKNPLLPLQESFGVDNEPGHDMAQAFTDLMWSEGNPTFSEIFKSMNSKMLQLDNIILRMVFESYGVGKLYNSFIQDSSNTFRFMKYKVPPNNEPSAMGLIAHTDKNTLTILCQNEVQGLEILDKDGNWVTLMIPNDAFIVIVGDGLKAWSNARIPAAKHRVVMSGNKERYSFGLFSMPKEGATIEVPLELVDNDHPLVYRPFKFSDFFYNFVNNTRDDALEAFAGV